MQIRKTDVVVIGAGAIGCAIAYSLSKQGMKVLVAEKDSIGAHASGYAPGILYPLGGVAAEFKEIMLPLTTESFQMHQDLYQQLPAESGVDYYFRKSTFFRLAFTDAESQKIKSEIEPLQQRGFEIHWLDGDTARKEINLIPSEVIGAAHYRDMAELDSYRYVLALAQAAEKHGAEIHYTQFLGLKREGTKLSAVQLSSGEIACGFAVLAMGPWTGLSSSMLGISVPVEPEKGQTLHLLAPEAPFTTMLGWDSYCISMTRQNGQIYYGATHEDAGFDEQPTVDGRDTLINSLVHMVPAMVDAQVVLQTACLRPLTADKLPIIGEVPGWGGVYLATGHWTKGILLSPITARIITDLMLKGATTVPIAPFSPSRFGSFNSE